MTIFAFPTSPTATDIEDHAAVALIAAGVPAAALDPQAGVMYVMDESLVEYIAVTFETGTWVARLTGSGDTIDEGDLPAVAASVAERL